MKPWTKNVEIPVNVETDIDFLIKTTEKKD